MCVDTLSELGIGEVGKALAGKGASERCNALSSISAAFCERNIINLGKGVGHGLNNVACSNLTLRSNYQRKL